MWWLLWVKGLIPPPVGAFAGGPGARWDGGRGPVGGPRQRSAAELSAGAVGDDEVVCGSGDGDEAAVVQPVVVGAYQHQVGYKSLIYLLLACILPVWRW